MRLVGRQTIATLFTDPLRTWPVCIRAGALGEGLPRRDLRLSPDHAILVDGVLVQAGALVDGAGVTRMAELPERFTYYHVELDDHALILAEGVPAETFVDNVTRRRFDNYREYEALYGDHAPLDRRDGATAGEVRGAAGGEWGGGSPRPARTASAAGSLPEGRGSVGSPAPREAASGTGLPAAESETVRSG